MNLPHVSTQLDIPQIIRSMTTRDRELLGHRIGTTGQYITSLVYKHVGRKNLPLMIELHKATNGAFDFTEKLNETYKGGIDWEYVRDVLNAKAEGVYDLGEMEFNAKAELTV